MKITLSVLLLLLTSSCYYTSSKEFISNSSVSVPYVKGDPTGELTNVLIKTICSSTTLLYDNEEGDLNLSVELSEPSQENISFQYQTNSSGELEDKLEPSENRLTAKVLVTLTNLNTNKIILGPLFIEESVHYDFNFQPIQSNINIFSLGQLNYIDDATKVALTPLYQKLAEKIVSAIENIWWKDTEDEEKSG
jgi:hypothetical protein